MSSNHLMHPRVAHNHASNGYFPTDLDTVSGITAKLDVNGTDVRIFDPCCGTGEALSHIADYLAECGSVCHSFGVELDKHRAARAEDVLDFVVQGDIESCLWQQKTVGLLFLNPPYGFSTADNLSSERTRRLEEKFFDYTVPCLQTDGIIVLIVPVTCLTERFTNEIASRFLDVAIFKAAVDTYKQVVIFGRKPQLKAEINRATAKQQQQLLLDFDKAPSITDDTSMYYEVPHSTIKVFRPINHRVEHDVLDTELEALSTQTLWPHFDQWFGEGLSPNKRRPLCALGAWHTALALAAGQVSGIVTSQFGRKLLVKGSTYKTKVVTVEEQERNNQVTVVTTHLDRFVPSIRAIDLTENSLEFGNVLTIK